MNWLANRQLEQDELGFAAPFGMAVCGACVGDDALVGLVRQEGDADECSFCGAEGENVAADTDVVLERIGAQLLIEWAKADGLLYRDPEERSGFVGPVYDIGDVLGAEEVEFGGTEFEAFVLTAFADTQYTPAGVYAVTPGEALSFGWGELVETVKHRQRFFFVLAPNDRSADGAGIPIPRGRELLNELDRLVCEYGLLQDLPAGTHLYRVRLHPLRRRYTTAESLGSPPPTVASQSRMSPAGIPMLYTAGTVDTAIAETVGTRNSRRKGLTIATFAPTESLRIVDFSQLSPIPSPFDVNPETPRMRHELGFLNGMRGDISGEVQLDGREHVEYVPTQVVCEYLRHQLPLEIEEPVHGLSWGSARDPGGRNTVLFFDQSRCVEEGQRPDGVDGPVVELLGVETRRLP